MSVIHAQRPLATGIDTAVLALKKGQDRLGVAALEVARQGASLGESSARESQKPKPFAQTPPNPGPPGGAVPGDLAQVMAAQNQASQARPSAPPVELAQATFAQQSASNEIAANVKTVQAFDAMLEELSRMKKTLPSE